VIASYLIDASAWWHLSKNPTAMERWHPFLAAGAVGVISPTRTEILRSATGPAHRDELAEELDAICGVPIPLAKDVWRQVDTAQYRLTQKSQHRGAGPVDLAVAVTAAHHGLTVLHVDNDYRAIAAVLPEVAERDVRN
jgi:predicted nucleic acid-binding protein